MLFIQVSNSTFNRVFEALWMLLLSWSSPWEFFRTKFATIILLSSHQNLITLTLFLLSDLNAYLVSALLQSKENIVRLYPKLSIDRILGMTDIEVKASIETDDFVKLFLKRFKDSL
jgi:hypothetical protein